MASSTNLPSANDDASVNPGSSLLKATFNRTPSQMELTSSSHLNKSSISSFANKILSEFDMHLPLNKLDQDLSAALWQQQPSAGSLLDTEKRQGFTFNSRMEANSFVSNIHDMKSMSELMNPPLAGGCWGPPGLDHDLAYSSSLTSRVPVSNRPLPSYLNRSTQGISEGFLVRELVDSNGHGKGVSTLASTSLITSTLPFGLGTEKTMNFGSDWSCVTGASISSLDVVDQSKAKSASQYLTNFTPDPGFAERAARFSCFGGHGYSELAPALHRSEPVKTCPRSASRSSQETAMKNLTQVLSFRHSAPSSPSIGAATELQDAQFVFDKVSRRSSPVVQTTEAQNHVSSAKDSGDMEVTLGQQEESSPSEIGECEIGNMGSAENSRRKKRKFGSKDKCKDTCTVMATTISGDKDLKNGANLEETKGKRSKNQGEIKEDPDKMQMEQSNSANSGDSAPNSIKENAKPSELPKQDYIHVRARRGQATDSHSLAERVRREKISERMKFLQELVPGCSKVTGKAVMLDEIINYVQSLQRQVEFLSMKLAAVNPRIDINLHNVNKETMQNRGGATSILFPADNTTFPVHHQPQQLHLPIGGSFGLDVSGSGNPGDLNLGRTMNSSAAASIDAYEEALCQLSQSWGDDLQSIVQMAVGQGKPGPLTTQRLSAFDR